MAHNYRAETNKIAAEMGARFRIGQIVRLKGCEQTMVIRDITIERHVHNGLEIVVRRMYRCVYDALAQAEWPWDDEEVLRTFYVTAAEGELIVV